MSEILKVLYYFCSMKILCFRDKWKVFWCFDFFFLSCIYLVIYFWLILIVGSNTQKMMIKFSFTRFFFFFLIDFVFREVLGSRQNWEEGTEFSHIPLAPIQKLSSSTTVHYFLLFLLFFIIFSSTIFFLVQEFRKGFQKRFPKAS